MMNSRKGLISFRGISLEVTYGWEPADPDTGIPSGFAFIDGPIRVLDSTVDIGDLLAPEAIQELESAITTMVEEDDE